MAKKYIVQPHTGACNLEAVACIYSSNVHPGSRYRLYRNFELIKLSFCQTSCCGEQSSNALGEGSEVQGEGKGWRGEKRLEGGRLDGGRLEGEEGGRRQIHDLT